MKIANKLFATLLLLLLGMSLWAMASVQISIKPESLKPGEKGVLKAVMTIPKGMHQTYVPGENDYFYLDAKNPNLSFGTTVYPAPTEKVSATEWSYHGTITFTKPFTVKASAKPGSSKINAEFAYNICLDSGACEPPETVNKDIDFKILGDPVEVAPLVETTETETTEEPAITPDIPVEEESIPVEPVKTEAQNIWKFLLMAFLGGLILNVMPCVLPVLSIKAMSIVKQAHEDKAQIMKHSLAYTMGILTTFILMAVVIIIIKMTGEAVGWGFQFQNTGFVLFLLSLIFVFALSLFDVFIINAPGMSASTKASSKGGVSGSYFSGIFAVLLATPCSAPMLGTALGFAFTQPPVMILIFFTLIGLGLALPFILLGFNPKWMKVIPKPGEWMNIFKEVMGFLLLGTAVWLLHVVFQQNGGSYLLRVLIYLVFLGFAAWMYGRFVRYEYSKTTQWIFTILAVIVIAGSAYLFLPVPDASLQSDSAQTAEMQGWEGWQTFSPDLVKELVDQGEPVFVDFGAKWCMTCLTNEKTVILTDAMKEAFAAKKVQLIHGDYTKKNPEIQAFMKQFGRAGVPFYVLYVPGQEPKLFPEIITIPMLKSALEEIK